MDLNEYLGALSSTDGTTNRMLRKRWLENLKFPTMYCVLYTYNKGGSAPTKAWVCSSEKEVDLTKTHILAQEVLNTKVTSTISHKTYRQVQAIFEKASLNKAMLRAVLSKLYPNINMESKYEDVDERIA